jgi:drug/metabolite transporter (DMT)-like permease
VSTVLFPISDLMAKTLTDHHSGLEVAWMRYAVLLAAVLPIVLRRPALLRTTRPALQAGRGVASAAATVLALTGFAYLPVADATAIAFCTPLIVTGLAAVILKEHVGPLRWAATAAGFAGVLIIVQPAGDGFQAASTFPLLSSVFSALTVILTRLGRDERIETTIVITTLVGFVLLSGPVALEWSMPEVADMELGLAMGALAAAATMLQLFAYRCASASLLAPFSYAQIVCAIGLGWFVGGATPSLTMLAGSAVVIASGAAAGWQPRRRSQPKRIDWRVVRQDLARLHPAMRRSA